MSNGTPAPAALFAGMPPPGIYFRRDEALRITSYNALAAVTLTIRTRFWRPESGISDDTDTQTPNTDRTAKTSIIRTGEGWLLGGQVFVGGAAPTIGQTFVVVEIVRGEGTAAVATQVLARGYATSKLPLAFPALSLSSSLDGAGALRSITGTTPAAGAEISETVPAGARWQPIAFKALLTTSAAVANRIPRMLLDDGANVFFDSANNFNHTAGVALGYRFMAGFGEAFVDSFSNLFEAIPVGLWLTAGMRLRTSTINLQAGDQWSAVQYLVREWLEGA